MIRASSFLVSVSVGVFLVLQGCSGAEAPRKQPESVIPKPAKVSEPKPAAPPKTPLATPAVLPVSPEASFQYNSEGRRDPFQSVIVVSDKKKSAEHLPPLQKMDLTELKLIGIVWGAFGYNAILQAPDGKGYPVKIGTRVGVNNGVVRTISSARLTVEETYTDIFGERKMKEVNLDLHPQTRDIEVSNP